jgi:hypothetical protein
MLIQKMIMVKGGYVSLNPLRLMRNMVFWVYMIIFARIISGDGTDLFYLKNIAHLQTP